MSKVIVSKRVNASVEDVWKSWDDFGNIYKYNPALKASRLLSRSDAPTRVGTQRQCDMADGKNWVREEVIEYKPGKSMKIDVYDGSLPLKSMTASIEIEEISKQRSRVRFTADFVPKFGIIGRLMAPLMKRQFEPLLQSLLDGNAEYVERGNGVALAA